jgi:hypothetical protein
MYGTVADKKSGTAGRAGPEPPVPQETCTVEDLRN